MFSIKKLFLINPNLTSLTWGQSRSDYSTIAVIVVVVVVNGLECYYYGGDDFLLLIEYSHLFKVGHGEDFAIRFCQTKGNNN